MKTEPDRSDRDGQTIALGRVTRPHGLRGEVKVRVDWEESDALARLEQVVLELGEGGRSARVLRARRAADHWIVHFEGIHDVDGAEALRGAVIHAAREALPAPEPDEYYLADLLGARVLAPEGVLGEVVGIEQYPSVDALVIRTTDGRTVEQAIVSPWVESVDPDRAEVRLSTTDGLVFS